MLLHTIGMDLSCMNHTLKVRVMIFYGIYIVLKRRKIPLFMVLPKD